MTDRTITLEVGARVTGAVNGLNTLGRSIQDADKKTSAFIRTHEQGINTLSRGFGVAGLALTGFATLGVKRFADFDEAMSAVGAATMESAKNMSLLRDAAIQAGADTQYSATQAAGAVEALAKAGVSTKDVLAGGLTGALNLAASAQMDIGEAAEIAATAMNQFGLEGRDTSHIADLLAASAGKAMGDVSDMAGALKFVGPVAHQMGITIEETAGSIAYLAQQGILGEQAGTSLRGMLSSLTSPSKIAAKTMDELGISMYDAHGQFVGFAGVADQLHEHMKDLTNAERDQALGRIFGNEQVTTARILYAEGGDAVRKWTDAVNDSGYASEQARIKTDNLAGDIERLGGSIETALIKGGSGANGTLRSLAQGADVAVDAIGRLPQPILTATTLLTGAGGMTALSVAGLGKMVTSAHEVRSALASMGRAGTIAKTAIGGIGAVLGVATLGFAAWADSQAKATQRVDDLKDSLDEATGAITRNTRATVFDRFEKDGTIQKVKELGLNLQDVITAAIDPSSDAYRRLAEEQKAVRGELDAIAQSGQGASAGTQELIDRNNALANILGSVAGVQGDVADSQERWRDQVAAGAGVADDAAGVQDGLKDSYGQTTDAIEEQVDALAELIDAQREAAGIVLSDREARRKYQADLQSAREALRENGKTLDITTEKGRENQEALDAVGDSALQAAASMEKNGASQKRVQGFVQGAREEFVGLATGMGMSSAKAEELADKLNLVAGNYTATVDADTSSARAKVDELYRHINNLKPRLEVIQTTTGIRVPAGTVPGVDTPPRKRATGGSVIGPGTGTSDSIPALLSNGEHVWTAREVVAAGGHGALERMRAAALAGALPAFASGGRVEWARDQRDRSLRAAKAAAAEAAAARRAQAREQRQYDAIGSSADERAAKRVAKRELEAARKAATRAQKAYDAAKGDYEDWKAQVSRLDELTRETRVAVGRGELVARATSGLSGAYGLVDELREQSRNTDLSAARRRSLASTATSGGYKLRDLYRQADALEVKLGAAVDRMTELQRISDQAASSIAGGFRIADGLSVGQTQHTNQFGEVWYTEQAVTGKSLLARTQGYAQKVKAFTLTLEKLQKKGFRGPVLAEIAGMGVEQGQQAADALLQLSAQDVRAYNVATTSFGTSPSSWASRAGDIVTAGFYTGGVNAAEGLVKGLESQQARIETSITKVAQSMVRALQKALGIASPSKVTTEVGEYTGQGVEVGLLRRVGHVEAAARRVAMAAVPQIPASVPMSVVPSGAPGRQHSLPPIYVQNPFTGEYLLAQVSTVAGRVVASHQASQDRASQYVGRG